MTCSEPGLSINFNYLQRYSAIELPLTSLHATFQKLLFFYSCTEGVLSLLRSAPRSGVAFVLARVQDARNRARFQWQLVSRTHKNAFLFACTFLCAKRFVVPSVLYANSKVDEPRPSSSPLAGRFFLAKTSKIVRSKRRHRRHRPTEKSNDTGQVNALAAVTLMTHPFASGRTDCEKGDKGNKPGGRNGQDGPMADGT
jgi:hypothetical protein